jgi:uncharacterized SAM-binding protein YcdF (DUF218 family)
VARRILPGRWWIAVLLAIAAIYLTHSQWMSALGGYLVKTDAPARAEIAVVLAGDGYGKRVLKAADLVRQGFTTKVLVSGPGGIYGHNEAELAIAFAVRHGNPESWFLPFPAAINSTREEAQAIAGELRRLGARRVILVTSNYHTRRAGRLFRAAAPELEFRVVAAEDEFFRPGDWWKSREAQERFVLEWMKTISGWWGI